LAKADGGGFKDSRGRGFKCLFSKVLLGAFQHSLEPLNPRHLEPFKKLIFCFLLLIFIQSPLLAQPPAYPEDTLLFREGEILLSRGETEKALWRFKRLLADFPKSPLYNEAKFRMGICYTQLKKPKEAIRVLNELFPTFLTPARMIQVFTLLGDNCVELKDRLTALHWYGKGLLVPGDSHEELKRRVRSIIDAYNSEEELNQIESSYRGAYGGGYAKLRLAQMAKGRGNDLLAKKILMGLEREYHGLNDWPQAKELLASISVKSKYTVGVILPLSGIQQPFGERALQGIQLGMKETDPEKNPLVSLVIRDSKGNPLEAENAVEDLVIKEKVIAIIGPLLSITTDRAAKKAQQLKVPLLTLSQKELLSGEDCIFQNSITPSDQIQTLVAFAIDEAGLRTFVVFYPNSPYGLHFKNLFTQEAVRRGGKVLGVAAYQEGQTDFSQEIKFFLKKDDRFQLNLPVGGLFIPDTHDRVGPILSQIASHNIKGLTFLGTNAWNSPGLLSIAGKLAEGTIFVDAFSKTDPSPLVARFVKEFKKAYQREPETLEALSYDGAKLLREILLSKQVSSPLQLKEELRQVQDFQGVTGLKGFGEGGKTIRALSILKVNKGQIEKISP
jgi:branched-chain amino acid transport system substrate-binding protein